MKITILFIMILLCFSSVNAGEFIDNYLDVLSSKNAVEYSNTFLYSIDSGVNATAFNITYDEIINAQLFDNMFLIIQAPVFLDNITIYYKWGEGEDIYYGETYIKSVLGTQDEFIFEFKPTYSGEELTILIDLPNGATNYNIITKTRAGLSNAMESIFEEGVNIIKINVGLWQILFYFIITVILFGFVVLLFGGALWFFKKAKRIQEGE